MHRHCLISQAMPCLCQSSVSSTTLGLMHGCLAHYHEGYGLWLMIILVLQGTLFHDRMKPEVVKQIKKDLVNLEEAYLSENAGAEIQRV